MNYAKNKAVKLVDKYKDILIYFDDDYDEWCNCEKFTNLCAISECEGIIKALDDIECDENHNVMESINEEEKFYNNVIKEIEKL